MSQKSNLPVRLFYSYCHMDEKHRDDMQRALSFLKRRGGLKEWSDLNIYPGISISKKIREEMNKADIMVFLLSSSFVASAECMKEWDNAKQRADGQKLFFRIPVILSECAWRDLLRDDDIKALPKDGKSVVSQESDVVWHEIYEGIKSVIDELRNTFTPKREFIQKMDKTDFISKEHIKLRDIFIFPTLLAEGPKAKKGGKNESDEITEEILNNSAKLLAKKFTLVYGDDRSGKSALGNYMLLTLAENSNPVLHIDMDKVSGQPSNNDFRVKYEDEFNGDYSLWKQKEGKTLILDNFSHGKNHIEWPLFAKEFFTRIIVILSSDVFQSFYMDEERFAEFYQVKIKPLTHYQQEQLIRKRLKLSDQSEHLTDGRIDEIEHRVNSIIISDKIFPRHPFFVLSILQTFEGFMPPGMSITSYGHCYNVLIVAYLIKAEINKEDKDINACFNFMEQLALQQYISSKQGDGQGFNLDEFIGQYGKTYHIFWSQINKLKQGDYRVIDDNGNFKFPYMHYFFLGKALSKKKPKHKKIIKEMCTKSYARENFLTLLFIIHHTNDDGIIDGILRHTKSSLKAVLPAKLDPNETLLFEKIVRRIPGDITSSKPVDDAREEERNARDVHDNDIDENNESSEVELINDLYRILRNNKIMGQILRNKCGSLERSRICEIIEVITDGGLRSIKSMIGNKKEIADFAQYLHAKYPDEKKDKLEHMLHVFCFIWTMGHIEKIVENINFPEIKQDLEKVVQEKKTPAYDLIGYFSALDSEQELTQGIKIKLEDLLKKHDDSFIQKMLSIRTQGYMNTHASKGPMEQAICALLKVKKPSGDRRKRRLL